MGRTEHPMTSGWLAGTIEITITYPLEFVKTQLQLQQQVRQYRVTWMPGDQMPVGNAAAVWCSNPCADLIALGELRQASTMATQNASYAYKGPLDVFSRTRRERGLLGLYRGSDSWIAFAGPRSAGLWPPDRHRKVIPTISLVIRLSLSQTQTDSLRSCDAVRFGVFEALTAMAQRNGLDRGSSVDTVCGFWAGETYSKQT